MCVYAVGVTESGPRPSLPESDISLCCPLGASMFERLVLSLVAFFFVLEEYEESSYYVVNIIGFERHLQEKR